MASADSTTNPIRAVFFLLFWHPRLIAKAASKLTAGDVNMTASSSSSEATALGTNENAALLNLNNIVTASKLLWTLTASSFSIAAHVPKAVYIPVKHSTASLILVVKAFSRPLHPLLAPLFLAFTIITTPVVIPVLLLYRLAVLVYPLYVFLGAALICGTLAGVSARILGMVLVENVLGVRSRARTQSSDGKEVSPRRSRNWTN